LDRILLHGVEFRGHHGVSSEERTTGGHYSVDVELEADTRRAGKTDHVADTVDYGIVHQIIRKIGEEERFQLLEALAERIAGEILQLSGVEGVRLCVRKHRPPLPGVVDYAAVLIERRIGDSSKGPLVD
jgi:dihydroneopterin aldolase